MFNLPSNIISVIYEMDSTYHDKIKENHHELWKKSFDLFIRNFLCHTFFQNKPILKNKLEFYFNYLFNHYDVDTYTSWLKFHLHEPNGEHSMFSKPMPSDIVINATWKYNTLNYNNNIFFTELENDFDDHDYDHNDDNDNGCPLLVKIRIPYYHNINFHERHYHFKGFVYSNQQYDENNRINCLEDPDGYNTISRYGTRNTNYFELFKYANENFSILQFLYN